MPTFDTPTTHAAEASEALRGLAHATRVIEDPADTYVVHGDLLIWLRSLRQVVAQLAAVHLTHRVRAHDDHGSQAGGATVALAVTTELQVAVALLDKVHDRVDAAMAQSGRIVWHPELEKTTLVSRWVSVVFLQGQSAEEVLAIIDSDGTDAAIIRLSGFDRGEETTQAALVNGYVYDVLPTRSLHRVMAHGDYTLNYNYNYNYNYNHVSLLRTHPETPELDAELAATTTAPTRAKARRSSPVVADTADWSAPSACRGRAL